ncbi:MMPL family transporter [Streptomyces sp. NP160]|uniref:MMPL family transporter n=1 Tax=Streptomyces sp. NP160 TaxID=2586637 RepID=UPI0011188040|nr:MMPL family transporter [Streptomyces sp. NP160]TNM68768.1 MMPL family transporter [Streptomyces sp. NP160]
MARWLYALGSLAARRPRTTIGTWLVLLALGVTGYLTLGGTLSSTVSLPGTPTARVAAQLQQEFPDASGGSGTVVFHAEDGGALTDAQRAQVSQLLERVATTPGVEGVVDPFTTTAQREQQAAQLEDGQQQLQAARAQLDAGQAQLDAGRAQLQALPAAAQQSPRVQAQLAALEQQQSQLDASRAQLEDQARQADLGSRLLAVSEGVRQVSQDGGTALGVVQFSLPQDEVTPETKEAVVSQLEGADLPGVQVALSQELVQEVPEVFGPGEAAGLVIAAVALLVVLGTAVAAAVPIVSALVGVGVGVTAALSLSGVVDMISVTPVLGVMLGLAVGIDYSLFLINRHRRQLLHGMPLRPSIALATGTAGNAVLFAGLTVVIALAALNVTGIGFLGLMGTVGAFCVLVAVAMAVTFTPAVLSLLGARVLRRKERAFYDRHDAAAERQRHDDDEAEEAAQAALRPMSTGRAVLTVVLGVAVLGLLAVPAASLRLGLPDGSSESRDSTQYQAFELTQRAFGEGVNGPLLVVADLAQPVTGTDQLAEQVRIAEQLKGLPDVAAVAPVGASADQRLLAFQVVPAGGPTDESTEALVQDIRDLPEGYGVAGVASGNIDVSEKLASALPGYLGLVVGLSLLILVVVFRSLLVPLTATLGFVLSLFATLGAITAVYQWGWLAPVFGVTTPGPVLSFLPTIVIGIMFGLAMDYQLFLVSGMREAYAHGASARTAVTAGVKAGRRVVVAAAIIMISVFAGFIGSDSVIIRSFGFGLAFGVLADAFVVRLLVIPAVMHLLGRSAWWLPRWLARVLPDVDVEGASLERSHGRAPAADAAEAAPTR